MSTEILLGPAERADVIVDFTNVPLGPHVLDNVGPDEPFGGGAVGVDFERANPETTGQVLLRMRFATPGPFVWHCHIVEHEDKMMRPLRIGPQEGQPA